MPAKPARAAMPTAISSRLIKETRRRTTSIKPIATARAIIVLPNFVTSLLASLVIAEHNAIMPTNPPIASMPTPMSAKDIKDIRRMTKTIISIAAESANIIAPSFAIFRDASGVTTFPNVAISTPIPTTIVPNAVSVCAALSGLRVSRIFNAAASIIIANAKPEIVAPRAKSFRPPAEPNLPTTIVNAAITPAKAATEIILLVKASASILDSTQTEAASTPIPIARFRKDVPILFTRFPIASIRSLNANALITLETLLSILEICFADLSRTVPTPWKTSPRPVIMSPKPRNGAVTAPITPISCFTMITRATLMPAAATVPQGIFLRISRILVPIPSTVSNSEPILLVMPFLSPSIAFSPISSISVDGEWIPRTVLIALSKLRPIFASISGIAVIPF